uniref:Uncharacterized protein n=1 Tax=Lygus hesperus TaxID=30085 RepID=A0A146LI53_LYGHE
MLAYLMQHMSTIHVLMAGVKYYEATRSIIFDKLLASIANGENITVVAACPIRTLLLRTFVEVDFDRLTSEHRAVLCDAASTLSLNPYSSPVLQRMIACDATGNVAGCVYRAIQSEIPAMVRHSCGSFMLQSLMQSPSVEVREAVIDAVMRCFNVDHNSDISKSDENMCELLSYAEGSRVIQRLIAYASDAQIERLIEILTSKSND